MRHLVGLASMCIAVTAGWITPFAIGVRRDGSIVFDAAVASPAPVFPRAMRDRQSEMIDASTQILHAHAAMRFAVGEYRGGA